MPRVVAVNISARQFLDPGFRDVVRHALADSGVNPALIELEITESAIMADPDGVAGELHRLRALGLALAIDDFGTGYSSLSLLARLPIDYLKIDSGFTRTIDDSDRDSIVVRAIVDLARALGLLVVAEGIESESQLARLKEIGVATWQGFLKSGPVPGDELLALME